MIIFSGQWHWSASGVKCSVNGNLLLCWGLDTFTKKVREIEEGVWQSCLLSLCLFNLYTEHIRWNAGLDELQGGIKIAGRNINNLRYVDNITLMAESKEELKNVLMRVTKENEKTGLKLNIKKTKIMTSGPITSWQIEGEKLKAAIFSSWCLKSYRWWLQLWN